MGIGPIWGSTSLTPLSSLDISEHTEQPHKIK